MILGLKDEWFYFGISLVLLLLHCFTLVFFVALETEADPFPGTHAARHALFGFHHSVQVFLLLLLPGLGPIKPPWV